MKEIPLVKTSTPSFTKLVLPFYLMALGLPPRQQFLLSFYLPSLLSNTLYHLLTVPTQRQLIGKPDPSCWMLSMHSWDNKKLVAFANESHQNIVTLQSQITFLTMEN